MPTQIANPKPRLVRTLKVTHLCNNHCKFCSDGDFKPEKEHLTTEQVLNLFAQARLDGVDGLTMTGGEPTTRKDLPQLITAAREMGFSEVAIVTNGRRVSYVDYAKTLVEAGLTAVTFSVHGHDSELHDHLVSANGAFKQMSRGINNMAFLKRYYPLAVSSIIVLTRKNAPHIEDILATFKSAIELFLIKYCVPDGFAKADPRAFMPEYEEIRDHLCSALSYARENEVRAKIFDIPLCVVPGFEDYLEHDDRTFEVMRKNGEFQQYSPSQKARSAKPPICQECKMTHLCPGAPASYRDLYGLEGLRPFR